MAMSDCPNCWDTPCTCGEAGYILSYPPRALALKYGQLLPWQKRRFDGLVETLLDEYLRSLGKI